MSSLSALCVVGALVGFATVAHAQGEPPGSAPASDDSYPTELDRRPLVLPSGVVEAQVQLRTISYGGEDVGIDIFDFLYTDVAARAGVGPIEVFAEADLLVHSPFDVVDTLERLGGGVRVPMPADAAIMAGVSFFIPGSTDLDQFESFATYVARRRTAENVAVRLGAGLRHFQLTRVDTDDVYITSVEGLAGGQVQVAPSFGVDAGVRLSVPVADQALGYEPDITASFEARAVFTTPLLDAYAGFEVQPTAFVSYRSLFVGVVGRLP